jgi:hypothetical protein
MKRLILVKFLIFILVIESHSYETNVHQKITGNAITASNIESYLKDNLKINLTDNFNDRTAQEWMEMGSVWEDDDLTMRWLNHFYDPTIGKGLNSFGITWGQPSLQWGKESSDNAWSWKWARDSYYKALTDSNSKYRDTYFSYVFRALGQIIHLIEDKAVPAHVRNDAHPYYFENYLQQQRDMYEKYTRDAVNDEKNRTNKMTPLKYTGYSAVDLTTFNTFDTFWINSGKGLAEYTNSNFLSRDTNIDDNKYSSPVGIGEWVTTETAYDPDYGWIYVDVKYLQGYATDNYRTGQSSPLSRLSALSYFDYEMQKYNLNQKVYSLNDYVHKEYADLLIPRAVGYSAGLLNYFFRGKIDLISDDTTGSGYLIENNSDEDMEGTFEVWYDDTNDNRKMVWGGYHKINANSKSSNISFNTPTDIKESCEAILIFKKGQMGQEQGAVVGKIVTLAGRWVQVGGCSHVWRDYMGWSCPSSAEVINGKYKYQCSHRYGLGFDCWANDTCVITDGGGCASREWCEEKQKTTDEHVCSCNDYVCYGIMSNVTESPSYVAPYKDLYGECVASSCAVYEMKCP